MGCLLLLSAVAGCGQHAEAGTENTEEITDDTFVVLVDRDVEQLDPRFVSDPNGLRVSRLIFASLVTIDPQTLEPVMDLAEGIELETPTRYVVTVRPGLQFADGSVLDADDVVATFESVVDPALAARHGHAYKRITRMQKRDARTVVFELDAPHATFLTDLELPILRAEDRGRRVGDVDGAAAVGAGPYQVVERVPGRLTLRANPRWYQGRVARERVRFVTVRDDNTRALRLRPVGDVVAVVAATYAVPGIPGGSIIAMVPALTVAGLPVEGMGILLAVDTVPDMFRTTANVTGTMVLAAILPEAGARPVRQHI